MPSLHIPADPTTQNHAEALAKVVFAARRWTLLTNLGGIVEAEDRDDASDAYQEAIDAADEAGKLCSVCGPSFREV